MRVKTTIANIGKYVASLSEQSFEEYIKIWLSNLEITKQEFYAIIDQINVLVDNNNFVDEIDEIEDVENLCYQYSTKLRIALGNI